jgi:hypothetical protein
LILDRLVEGALESHLLHALGRLAALLGCTIGYAFGLVGSPAELIGGLVLEVGDLVYVRP